MNFNYRKSIIRLDLDLNSCIIKEIGDNNEYYI